MADTYTKIPNWLIEKMSEIKPSVFKVCVAIARSTIGYQKEWERLTISQLMGITGLSNRSVIDSLDEAIADGLIEKRESKSWFEYKLKSEFSEKSSLDTTENSENSSPNIVENSEKSSLNNSEKSSLNLNNSEEISLNLVKKVHRIYINKEITNTLSTNVDVQSTQTSLSSDGKKQKPDKPKKVSQLADADEPTQTPEHQEWFGALFWLVYGHKVYKLVNKENKIAVGKTSKEIRGLGYSLDDLRNWYASIWCKEFPGLQNDGKLQRPTLKQIKAGIGKVKPTTHTNGFDAPVVQANVPTYKRMEQL